MHYSVQPRHLHHTDVMLYQVWPWSWSLSFLSGSASWYQSWTTESWKLNPSRLLTNLTVILVIYNHKLAPVNAESLLKWLGNVQCESKKIPPTVFWNFFPNGWEFLISFFTHILYKHYYTRLQIFIQLSPTLTKLCHTKRNHPTNFYISLEV